MNTRFRPTPYGDPHLGHLFIARANYGQAKGRMGRFILQADDVFYNRRTYWRDGYSLKTSVAHHAEMLEWAGCPADEVWYSSSNDQEQRRVCEVLGIDWPPDGEVEARITLGATDVGCGLSMGASACPIVVTPWYQAVRIADDHACNISAFIRGFDLACESSMYTYLYSKVYQSEGPRQCYLPVIARRRTGAAESSSEGSVTLMHLRDAGYTPHQLKRSLQAIEQYSFQQSWSAFWIPAGFLEPGQRRPVPFVLPDFAAAIRGAKMHNVIDQWAERGHDKESVAPWLDEMAERTEAEVRDDLVAQGFKPQPIIAAIKRGKNVYEFACERLASGRFEALML